MKTCTCIYKFSSKYYIKCIAIDKYEGYRKLVFCVESDDVLSVFEWG